MYIYLTSLGPQVSWKVRGWIRSVFLNILKAKPSDKKKYCPHFHSSDLSEDSVISPVESYWIVWSLMSLSALTFCDSEQILDWKSDEQDFYLMLWVEAAFSFLKLERGISEIHPLTPSLPWVLLCAWTSPTRAAEAWPHPNAESKAAFFQSKWFLCSSKFEKGSRPLCFNLQVAILVGSLINLIGCCQQEKIILGYIAYHMVKENNTTFLFHFCMSVPVCVYTGLKSQAKS